MTEVYKLPFETHLLGKWRNLNTHKKINGYCIVAEQTECLYIPQKNTRQEIVQNNGHFIKRFHPMYLQSRALPTTTTTTMTTTNSSDNWIRISL